MAVVKMKKATLIAYHSEKTKLLKATQELQKLELIQLKANEDLTSLLVDYQCEEHEDTRLEAEKQLRLIQNAQAFLQPYLPVISNFKKMQAGRKSYSLAELEERVKDSQLITFCQEIKEYELQLRNFEQLRKDQNAEIEHLIKWQDLSIKAKDYDSLRYFTILIGTVPIGYEEALKQSISETEEIVFEEVFQNRHELGCILITRKSGLQQLNQLLASVHFIPLSTPFTHLPKDRLWQLKKESRELIEKQAGLKKQLGLYQEQRQLFELGEEYYGNLLQREKAKALIVNGRWLFILTGWLEAEEVAILAQFLAEDLPENSFALIHEEIQEQEMEQVPTVLKNNKLVEPFETLTEMYSLPKYNEVDPTPLLTPFYLVFFGMMVADIGYGLLLLFATLLTQKLLKLETGVKKSFRFFNLLAYPTIIWGCIYGSFFGYSLPFYLLNPQKDVNTLLITSVVFGFIQLVFGLCVNGVVLVRKKQLLEGYFHSFSWIGILIGIALLLLGVLIFQQTIPVIMGGLLIGVNVLGILASAIWLAESKWLGLGKGLYALYGITGYIGDLVSYTRLMALGIAGGSIAQAFNLIIDLLPPVGKFTIGVLLFAFLHAINIFLSFLSAYVHGARLQYVEFFGKFYEGGGHPLKPLKGYEKTVYLKKREIIKENRKTT